MQNKRKVKKNESKVVFIWEYLRNKIWNSNNANFVSIQFACEVFWFFAFVWLKHASKAVVQASANWRRRKNTLEECIPKSTRSSTKWSFKVFFEWQIGRANKDPSKEQRSFEIDIGKVLSLDTNIANMNVKSLNYCILFLLLSMNLKHYTASHVALYINIHI